MSVSVYDDARRPTFFDTSGTAHFAQRHHAHGQVPARSETQTAPSPAPRPPLVTSSAPPSHRRTVTGVRLATRPSPSTPSTVTTSRPSTTYAPASAPSTPIDDASSIDRWTAEYGETFHGLSDDEIFKIVSRPPAGPGVEHWAIPAPSNEKPSEALQAKVANFLRLKVDQDRHINTTLLASTAFANPHIYAKLVDFVEIDERGSAFPRGGWLTRRGLEDRIPVWGARGIAAQQKAQETARVASQATGNRKAIDFTSSGSGRKRRHEAGRHDERHGSVESGKSHRDVRATNGEQRDSEGSSRRGEVLSSGGASGRYGRDGDREGKKKDRDRRWE